MRSLAPRERPVHTPSSWWSTLPDLLTDPRPSRPRKQPVSRSSAKPLRRCLELSKIKTGQTLLILGASGGVGSLAVQLARNAGVHVIVTARQSKAAALEQLGAERVVDLTQEQLENIGQVDAVLNLVGGDTVVPSYALVKPGGVAVTANRPPIAEEAARLGIEAAFVETDVTTEGLNAFATLVTDGKIKPQIAAVETLWLPDSLWEKRETEGIGKIVFSIRS